LLVDDQPANLDLLSNLLEEQGYEVRQAIRGTVALQAVASAQPDLILLDINMPELDGYTVCQRLKADAQTKDIPVIFVSALDEAWDKVKAFSVGGVDYITKPFKVIEVLARVENQLKIRYLQCQLQSQNAQLHQEVQNRLDIEAQLRQANQELQRLAAIDELTQIANRHRFDDYFQTEWRRAAREQHPLALILCDVDAFAQYNQTYGSEAGGQCLCHIAQELKRAVQRPGDLVCRYGEGTYAIVLPNTTTDSGQHVAKLVLHQIQALQIPHSDSPASPYVSLSVGIASTIPSQVVAPSTLIEGCDRALRQAQAEGGNRMVAQQG
jgi:diguanylate cyclase (GGDEF)-like protein